MTKNVILLSLDKSQSSWRPQSIPTVTMYGDTCKSNILLKPCEDAKQETRVILDSNHASCGAPGTASAVWSQSLPFQKDSLPVTQPIRQEIGTIRGKMALGNKDVLLNPLDL